VQQEGVGRSARDAAAMSTARVRRMEAAHTSRVPRFSSPHVPNALKGTTLARHNGRVENYVDSLVEAFKVRFSCHPVSSRRSCTAHAVTWCG
jgi:hypothetical protein